MLLLVVVVVVEINNRRTYGMFIIDRGTGGKEGQGNIFYMCMLTTKILSTCIIKLYLEESVLKIYRKSGLSLACFLILSKIVVYHWSSREMLSYSLTASVNPSMFCSSKCSHNVYKKRIINNKKNLVKYILYFY